MERILNKVFMYIWLVCALAAVICAFAGACHQLFTALFCTGLYITARCDWKKTNNHNKYTLSVMVEAIDVSDFNPSEDFSFGVNLTSRPDGRMCGSLSFSTLAKLRRFLRKRAAQHYRELSNFTQQEVKEVMDNIESINVGGWLACGIVMAVVNVG